MLTDDDLCRIIDDVQPALRNIILLKEGFLSFFNIILIPLENTNAVLLVVTNISENTPLGLVKIFSPSTLLDE